MTRSRTSAFRNSLEEINAELFEALQLCVVRPFAIATLSSWKMTNWTSKPSARTSPILTRLLLGQDQVHQTLLKILVSWKTFGNCTTFSARGVAIANMAGDLRLPSSAKNFENFQVFVIPSGFIQNPLYLNKKCNHTNFDVPEIMEHSNFPSNVVSTKYGSRT